MKRVRPRTRPRTISSAEDFIRLILQTLKRVNKLSLKYDQPVEFFISSSVAPLSYSADYRRVMHALNKRNSSIPIHVSSVPCTDITPETEVLCIVRFDGQHYVHRHTVGECWFLIYPKDREILPMKGDRLA